MNYNQDIINIYKNLAVITKKYPERLIDVLQTRSGFLSFGYNYQKTPYQVFEVGEGAPPWATRERDPRRLIDKSIREAAAELALGRLYTRRL